MITEIGRARPLRFCSGHCTRATPCTAVMMLPGWDADLKQLRPALCTARCYDQPPRHRPTVRVMCFSESPTAGTTRTGCQPERAASGPGPESGRDLRYQPER